MLYITEPLFIFLFILGIAVWAFATVPHTLAHNCVQLSVVKDLLSDQIIKIHMCEPAFKDVSIVVKLSDVKHKELKHSRAFFLRAVPLNMTLINL